MPTRLGPPRRGARPRPREPLARRPDRRALQATARSRSIEGCPCPACAAGLTRGYLRYLVKSRELTGLRLLTLHNLAFVARVMARLRDADRGPLPEEAAALRAGAAP